MVNLSDELIDLVTECIAVYEVRNSGKKFYFKKVNRALEKVESLSRQKIIGADVEQIFPGIVQMGLLEVFKNVWKTGKPEKLEKAIYKDNIRNRLIRTNRVYKISPTEIVAVYSDSAKEVDMERRIIESEAAYKEFLDNAPILVQSIDENGKYTYVNRKWRSTLGYNEDELEKLTFFDIVSPDQKEYCKKWFNDVKKGIERETIETTFIKKNGAKIFVEGSIGIRKSPDKKCIETVGFFYDSTQKLLYKQNLEKLSKISENSPAGIILTDESGNIEYVNHRFCEITGYDSSEVIHQNPRILKSGDLSKKDYEIIWKKILSGKVWKGEFRNRRKDGSIYLAATTISPIKDDNGKITNFVGIQEDITEKRKSEEEMKLFSSLAIDRELRMADLKKEVNSLLKEQGKPAKYQSHDF